MTRAFRKYVFFAFLGVLLASFYPLSMGVRAIWDMIADGVILKENYPKYVIPYTPISLSVIAGVLLMPVFIRFFKKYSFALGAITALALFFVFEFLFEQKMIIANAEQVVQLDDWQMAMCYIPPKKALEMITPYKTQTAVEILMGEYNPAFKMHFYLISVILIVSILNCLYGFGQMIKSGEKKRKTSLILQFACSLLFLGLCIFACFTAFFRDGNIRVSPLSAALMAIFFTLLGITSGIFIGSFLLEKRKLVSVGVPSLCASFTTLLMYIGEMILLNKHLYQLGVGYLFDNLPGIILAPVDLLVILSSGCITALIFALVNGRRKHADR